MFNLFKNKTKKTESKPELKTLTFIHTDYIFEIPLSATNKVFGSTLIPLEELKKEDTAQVLLVAIYNIDELASNIAKYLKNSTCDSGDSDKGSNQSPKP